MYSIDWKREWL